jgi:hypothetical protein
MIAQPLVKLAPVILLIAGLAGLLAAILVAGDDNPAAGPRPEATPELACVEGGLAENPVERGRVRERQEQFATIEEAEAFLCHPLAYPRETPGWQLWRIRAERSHPLAQTLQGIGDAYVILDYADPDHPWRYIIFRHAVLPFVGQVVRNAADEPLVVQGQQGFLRHGGTAGEVVVANWDLDEMQFRVTTVLDAEFTLADFQVILESVR